MAKNAIIQYDPTTAANNTDVGGVGMQGTSPPRNIDNAFQTIMKHIGAGCVPRRSAKSGGYTAIQTDFGQTLDFTAAATLATDAAATLLDGWYCQVYASGGDVTINPNSSETVNGEPSITLQKGAFGVLRVNDGNFIFSQQVLRGTPLITPYTAGGTHTFRTSTQWALVVVWGAGGGGRNTDSGATRSGPGGGAGACAIKFLYSIPDTATITIGAAGSAGNSGGTSSYDDGTTTVTATGGTSGTAVTSTGDAGTSAGGTATGGDINIAGQPGEPTSASTLARSGTGGRPAFGVGSPGIGTTATSGVGSHPYLSASGYAAGAAGANNNGSAAARTAGSGTPGYALIVEFG